MFAHASLTDHVHLIGFVFVHRQRDAQMLLKQRFFCRSESKNASHLAMEPIFADDALDHRVLLGLFRIDKQKFVRWDDRFTIASLSGYGRLQTQYKPRKLSSYLFAVFSGSLF